MRSCMGFLLPKHLKKALFERIEDEYDVTVANEAYQDYLDSGCRSTPIEEFWRELDEEEVGADSGTSARGV